jgi:transcriptional regulator with XRE-family HTH domain
MVQPTSVFSALLRYWRGRRGLSQLDLALTAAVSPRHVSFLETGRARHSAEMVLHLAGVLDLPLRERNVLLQAAGFPQAYEEPPVETSPIVAQVLERMLAHHEPFPMLAYDGSFEVVNANQAARVVLGRFVAEPERMTARPNLFLTLFDPHLMRPFVLQWEEMARGLVHRLHVEALARPHDERPRWLLEQLLAMPDVPSAWQKPDFSLAREPVLAVRMRRDDVELAFLSAITRFSVPQTVTTEELTLESLFPLDEATERWCRLCGEG